MKEQGATNSFSGKRQQQQPQQQQSQKRQQQPRQQPRGTQGTPPNNAAGISTSSGVDQVAYYMTAGGEKRYFEKWELAAQQVLRKRLAREERQKKESKDTELHEKDAQRKEEERIEKESKVQVQRMAVEKQESRHAPNQMTTAHCCRT